MSPTRAMTARVWMMSVACCAFAEGAICQTLPARTVKGIEAADSLVSAEFAKDSIGSTLSVLSRVRNWYGRAALVSPT